MHTKLLGSLGYGNFVTHIFEINETLSDINSGPYHKSNKVNYDINSLTFRNKLGKSK